MHITKQISYCKFHFTEVLNISLSSTSIVAPTLVFADVLKQFNQDKIFFVPLRFFFELENNACIYILSWITCEPKLFIKSVSVAEILAAVDSTDEMKMLLVFVYTLHLLWMDFILSVEYCDQFGMYSILLLNDKTSIRVHFIVSRYNFPTQKHHTDYWACRTVIFADFCTKRIYICNNYSIVFLNISRVLLNFLDFNFSVVALKNFMINGNFIENSANDRRRTFNYSNWLPLYVV